MKTIPALNLDAPWRIVKVEFMEAGDGRMELHLTIDSGKGEVFACPCDGCRRTASLGSFPCAAQDAARANLTTTEQATACLTGRKA